MHNIVKPIISIIVVSIVSLLIVGCQDNTTDPDTTDPVIEPTPYDTLESGEWHYLGLDGVRISDLKVDPFDRNIIFAGMASNFSARRTGKLFRSMDGGFSWDTLLTNISVNCIDLSVLTPGKVIVTGSQNSLNPKYLLVSEDYGESWSDIPMPPYADYIEHGIGKCKMSRYDDMQIFAKVTSLFTSRFYRSSDFGKTWNLITYEVEFDHLLVLDYEFSPFVEDQMIVLKDFPPFIVLTEDFGDSFTPLNSPIDFPKPNVKYNPYKINQIVLQDSRDGIFISNDMGTTWNILEMDLGGIRNTLDFEFVSDGIITEITDTLSHEIMKFDFEGNFIESFGHLDTVTWGMEIECYSDVILIGSYGVYVRRI